IQSVSGFTLVLPDTSTYANEATRLLIRGARQRYEYQDSLVRDYSATVRTRIDIGMGRSRFARVPPILAHETAARLRWALPNDIKVEVLGQRGQSIFEEADSDIDFDQPWFVPRSLGDSIRFLDDELPAVAALHPLAPGAETSYSYAIADSVTITLPDRTVEAIGVRVQPKTLGPSLIAGDIWFDAQTLELVRMTFVFLGEYNWSEPPDPTPEDSAEARKENLWASRIIKLEADLEYALINRVYWMPYRQLVQLTVEIPWVLSAKIPIRFLSEFDDYEINTAQFPMFEVPLDTIVDTLETGETRSRIRASGRWQNGTRCRRSPRNSADSLAGEVRRSTQDANTDEPERILCDAELGFSRAGASEQGGRWEIHYAAEDSLAAFDGWEEPLTLALSNEEEERIRETIESLSRLEETLPEDWIGRMPHHFAFENFTDIHRFNRVQGHSLGGGYLVRPGLPFTTLTGKARLSFGDLRITGSLTWRRDAPRGTVDVVLFRDLDQLETWTQGLGFGNSANAWITGHDDANYFLKHGGSVTYASNGLGFWRNAKLSIAIQQETTVETVNSYAAPVGDFRLNPPITDGVFLRAMFQRSSPLGPVQFSQKIELAAGRDESDVTRNGARVHAAWRIPLTLSGRRIEFRAAVTKVFGDSLPQLSTAIGGVRSVRGFSYGFRQGRQAWFAGVDVMLNRRELWSPVIFADIGDTAFDLQAPMIGLGGGISVLRGSVSLIASQGIVSNIREPIRIDLRFYPLSLPAAFRGNF
ncbi:MAG: hypothetical protein OEZ54_06290, partial [Gemmatimonadota bacterium]|nr:hypothetical protein [Gemmatimonadota bacterium]